MRHDYRVGSWRQHLTSYTHKQDQVNGPYNYFKASPLHIHSVYTPTLYT